MVKKASQENSQANFSKACILFLSCRNARQKKKFKSQSFIFMVDKKRSFCSACLSLKLWKNEEAESTSFKETASRNTE